MYIKYTLYNKNGLLKLINLIYNLNKMLNITWIASNETLYNFKIKQILSLCFQLLKNILVSPIMSNAVSFRIVMSTGEKKAKCCV